MIGKQQTQVEVPEPGDFFPAMLSPRMSNRGEATRQKVCHRGEDLCIH